MIALDAEASLRLERGSPVEMTCVSGMLWITCEGDLYDRFLGPGESLMLTTRGLTLVTALGRSLVRVVELPAARLNQTWLTRILFNFVVSRAPRTHVRALFKPNAAG